MWEYMEVQRSMCMEGGMGECGVYVNEQVGYGSLWGFSEWTRVCVCVHVWREEVDVCGEADWVGEWRERKVFVYVERLRWGCGGRNRVVVCLCGVMEFGCDFEETSMCVCM